MASLLDLLQNPMALQQLNSMLLNPPKKGPPPSPHQMPPSQMLDQYAQPGRLPAQQVDSQMVTGLPNAMNYSAMTRSMGTGQPMPFDFSRATVPGNPAGPSYDPAQGAQGLMPNPYNPGAGNLSGLQIPYLRRTDFQNALSPTIGVM